MPHLGKRFRDRRLLRHWHPMLRSRSTGKRTVLDRRVLRRPGGGLRDRRRRDGQLCLLPERNPMQYAPRWTIWRLLPERPDRLRNLERSGLLHSGVDRSCRHREIHRWISPERIAPRQLASACLLSMYYDRSAGKHCLLRIVSRANQ